MGRIEIPRESTHERIAVALEAMAKVTDGENRPKRYGVKINKNDGNPDARIEYILDATDFIPARMNYAADKFEYGSWENLWFIKENYPCMLKYDGREDYRLNPNDYSKKLDGTASDVANVDYLGNAMSSIPLVWIKQYEIGGYEYIILCEKQYDETYKAYAHTRADGSIMDKIYLAMFGGGDDDTRLRSISGMQPMHSKTGQQEVDKAVANGNLWNTRTWAHRNLINSLLTVISKHDNLQIAFGNGNLNYQSSLGPTYGVLETGTLNTVGQFMGYNDSTHQVKVFHMERWWADQWERIQGLLNVNGDIRAKMIPPYNFTGAGFQSTGVTPTGTHGGYISRSEMKDVGRIPSVASGTSSTYQCDGLWFNNAITAVARVGGFCNHSVQCGSSCVNLSYPVSRASWSIGAALSCEEPLVA